MTTVCFDFDGVLAEYDDWKDGTIGEPLLAGVELVRLCDEAGFTTVLQTCRTHPIHGPSQQLDMIKYWLRKHKVPIDEIELDGKPVADYYVDDRGLHFNQLRAKTLGKEYAAFLMGHILDKEEKRK